MKKLRKNKKGFTLVELVVVIAILAILASTATVATIAILNNARKTPITDAAATMKTYMPQYVLDSNYGTDKAGLTKYLEDLSKDFTVDTATGTNVTSASGDAIHIMICPAPSKGYKSDTWSVIVYNQYYKIKVTYNYANGNFTNVTMSDAKKLNENF